jgi:hypothetical protein
VLVLLGQIGRQSGDGSMEFRKPFAEGSRLTFPGRTDVHTSPLGESRCIIRNDDPVMNYAFPFHAAPRSENGILQTSCPDVSQRPGPFLFFRIDFQIERDAGDLVLHDADQRIPSGLQPGNGAAVAQ